MRDTNNAPDQGYIIAKAGNPDSHQTGWYTVYIPSLISGCQTIIILFIFMPF